jgi:hypothetical protein
MPVIQEQNRLYFWFDTNKPRREEGKAEAIARYAYHKGLKRERHASWHSLHHVDGNRNNGKADNLFVCETQKQHNNLHLQLQEIMTQFIQAGLVQFDWIKKRYFVDDNYLTAKIKGNEN